MNNKSENIINLINFIKNIGNHMTKILDSTFPNITCDMPWKEYDNYPLIFSFFTNKTVIFLDSNSEEINLEDLSNDNTYSIIFEINNLRIIPIKLDLDLPESYILKINLVLLLIKTDIKKDFKIGA
jgi:hypothetical protein